MILAGIQYMGSRFGVGPVLGLLYQGMALGVFINLILRVFYCFMRFGNFTHNFIGHRVVFHIATQQCDFGLGGFYFSIIGHDSHGCTAVLQMLRQPRLVRISQADPFVK